MFQVIHHDPITKARVIEAIEITAKAGKGTEEEPIQLVTYYFDREGNWLATRNPPIKMPSREKTVSNPQPIYCEHCGSDDHWPTQCPLMGY